MANTLLWLFVGIFLYMLVMVSLQKRGLIPDYIKQSGPITTVHTRKGKVLLERLAEPRWFWRWWTNLGIGIALVVMFLSFLMVVTSAYFARLNPPSTQLTEPRNLLAIPGVNDFLPLSVAPEIAAGFVLTLVIHEAGHGLLCRVADIDIASMGLASVAFIPLGAFVEPDEADVTSASRGDQARMLVAGVTNNFALGLLCLALLAGPVAGTIGVVGGVPVGGTLPQSPAEQADIGPGSVITSVDGQPVDNSSELSARLTAADENVEIGLRSGGERTVTRSVFVTSAVEDGPVAINRTIRAVNGTEVRTKTEYQGEVDNRSVATLSFSEGENVTIPIGAYAVITDSGPLASAGVTTDQPFYITQIDGERTASRAAVFEALSRAKPGSNVTVTGYSGMERQSYQLTLEAPSDSDPGLGVQYIADGTSGFAVSDFGVRVYPAGRFLENIGGNAPGASAGGSGSFLAEAAGMLWLPFASVIGGEPYNFAGFTGFVTNFYTVTGPLGVLGTDGVFLLANLLFWTGWLNIVVGQFNLIPTYPLDGGHVLRICTESVVSRLSIANRRPLVTAITIGVSLLIVGSTLFTIIAPRVLA